MDDNQRTYVAQSLNPHAGEGLFAARAFKKGERVATMTGDIVPLAHLNALHRGYAIEFGGGNVLDPLTTTQGSLGHKANSPQDDPMGRRANAEFRVDRRNMRINLVATRNISQGDEILVPYGARFSRELSRNAN